MFPSNPKGATVCLVAGFLFAYGSAFQTRQKTINTKFSLTTNPSVSFGPSSCFSGRLTRIHMNDDYGGDGNDPPSESNNAIISPQLNAEAALQAEVAEAVGTAEYEAADVTTVVAPTPNVGVGVAASDEARQLLALEMNGVGPDGIPESPMMTYEKYLTMQEKRVKVTIRYSANAGLRPFYLTVANQIKSTHPDVLLEKRILPPIGSDAGGDGAIFEVVVDGKTVIGKKKTKLLKVRSSSSSRSSSGDDSKDEDKSEGGSNGGKGGNGEVNPPDIAGGRSIFVSMEKLDQELSKARKKRRPNTAYERKSDAVRVLRGVASGVASSVVSSSFGGKLIGDSSVSALESSGMSDAVMRLERLKAISNSRKK